eukprot:Cvel_5247.t1-p1 / transcript=Cvel_5247.t1 / gene=Cvel_5247 / organism=Chromera_velia_CCMP2878 / gene_product=Leukotriene A-4 hydrolase homolog, putative / transcript_product=Leukotriene A-4 hydrolase homolog, putative / location=Cvel_scaffold242:1-7005(-) / protein_length=861 / sequence_SO=supercontig / SO=protein_coding / is_pseudo=false
MSGDGARDHSTFSNYDEIFTQHLSLDLTVDFEQKKLVGSVSHTLTVNRFPASGEVWFDTRNVSVEKVTLESSDGKSSPLSFSFGEESEALGKQLKVELPSGQKQQKYEVKIFYSTGTGEDCPAGQFLDAIQTADKTQPFYFTQCQAIHARSIVPCQDTPARKITYTGKLKVPSGLQALMSAHTTGKEEKEGDGETIFTFNQPVSIPTYLLTILAGRLERREISGRCAVWAEPSLVEASAWEFAETETFLKKGEELCGKYVWGRYDLVVLPPSFPYGGMENPMLTFVTPTLLAGDRSHANVVIHEIAHSWSGNLVTNERWDDFWMNEGFTVFTERAVLRELEGKEAASLASCLGVAHLEESISSFGASHEFTKLQPQLRGEDPDDAFSSVPYEKGYLFLLWLQQLVVPGEPLRFHKFLKKYFDKHAGGVVRFDDFKSIFLSEFPPEKFGAVHMIDWEEMRTEPGMPKKMPYIDERPRKRVEELANSLATSSSPLDDPKIVSEVSSWGSVKRTLLLQRLLEKAPEMREAMKGGGAAAWCQKLDDSFGFSKTKDCEVKSAWCLLGIALDFEPAAKLGAEFVGQQGRMKFTRPMYKALMMRGGSFEALARETFAKERAKYHAVCAKMVERDLRKDWDAERKQQREKEADKLRSKTTATTVRQTGMFLYGRPPPLPPFSIMASMSPRFTGYRPASAAFSQPYRPVTSTNLSYMPLLPPQQAQNPTALPTLSRLPPTQMAVQPVSTSTRHLHQLPAPPLSPQNAARSGPLPTFNQIPQQQQHQPPEMPLHHPPTRLYSGIPTPQQQLQKVPSGAPMTTMQRPLGMPPLPYPPIPPTRTSLQTQVQGAVPPSTTQPLPTHPQAPLQFA